MKFRQVPMGPWYMLSYFWLFLWYPLVHFSGEKTILPYFSSLSMVAISVSFPEVRNRKVTESGLGSNGKCLICWQMHSWAPSQLFDGVHRLEPSQFHGEAKQVDQQRHLPAQDVAQGGNYSKVNIGWEETTFRTWAASDRFAAARFHPVRCASLIVSTFIINMYTALYSVQYK